MHDDKADSHPTAPATSDGKAGFDWRSLFIAKSIDIVFIPLGLFAALWFQGWVDDRQAQADYVDQLQSFRAEVIANRDKGAGMATQLGDLREQGSDNSLGPLGSIFPVYDTFVASTADTIECIELSLAPIEKAPTQAELDALAATEEGREQLKADIAEGDARTARLAACDKILQGVGTAPEPVFQVVDLSPLYRYEVWQMYLQDGIKLFKDEEARVLGRKLGEAYALAREVEQRVAEIEDAYNEELMRRFGAQAAVVAEVDHLLKVSGGTEDPLPRFHELASEMRRARYSMLSFQAMLGTKVARVKAFVQDMADRLGEVDTALALEMTRNE